MQVKRYKKLLIFLLAVIATGAFAILGINYYVLLSQSKNIVSTAEASGKKSVTHILVLGCGVFGDEPSAMLEDRLLRTIEVAAEIPEARLILSGNNSGEEYNEVGVMKSFCLKNGISEERILTDDYGFSTGESITNLKKVFKAEKVIIVTQKYHLSRAMHIASQYGIEAYGVPSNQRRYKMQLYYSLREVAARNKDFFKYLFI